MNRYRSLLAAAVMCVLPSLAQASPLFTLNTPSPAGNIQIQVGSRFQLIRTLNTSAIGAYAGAAYTSGGVTTSDFTGLLYNGGLTLIEKVLIPTGTAVDANGFAYANFASAHTLPAGQQFVITAWRGGLTGPLQNYLWSEAVGSATILPHATFLNTQFILNSTAAPTSTLGGGFNDFGANLQVPEPVSLALFGAAMPLLVRRNRR